MVEGGALFDRIVSKSSYTEKGARDLMKVLLETIAYLHNMGIVHRDLKPENVLLSLGKRKKMGMNDALCHLLFVLTTFFFFLVLDTDNTDVKIADFGSAKKLKDLSPNETAVGTPSYVAPEILRGDRYGAEVDVWSLGVICYVLLCGYPPFYDEHQKQMFAKIKKGKYDFDEKYWSNTSPEAIDMIQQMLCVDQSKRWTSAQLLDHPWMRMRDETLQTKGLQQVKDILGEKVPSAIEVAQDEKKKNDSEADSNPEPTGKETSPLLTDDEKYMKEALSEGKKEWRRSKIMIVGEGRAGKTALANSILGRAYENLDSTIGINEFTCSIGYANVGGRNAANGLNEKNWKELKDQKKSKELEGALASMIFDQKTSKLKSHEKKKKLITEDVDEMIKRLKGGYLEGETHGVLEIKNELTAEEETVVIDRLPALKTIRSLNEKESKESSHAKQQKATKQQESSSHSGGKVESHSFIPHSSEIDTSLVMKYLGEQSTTESQFIISVFDFGGQSVFNVIHPFFLTRFGVYIITFNMEWMSSSADAAVREECIRYMSFWLNSVIVHTQNEKGQVAPVMFVGTRKDLITSPAEHQAISTSLYNIFCNSLAWSYVIENNGAEGSFGKADLCFFPVNNKLGNEDPTVQKLLQLVEKSIDGSSYVHVERPLSWFQVLDIFKSKNVPYLEYSEVESIIVSCNIPKTRVPTLLTFFHEIGILMWHDEDTLRDIIVFDPIEYFVKPATIIICKHVPDQADGIYHSLEIHQKVKKLLPKEFREMIQYGIVAEELLAGLLEQYSENYVFIKQLMLKYGLLVPLTLSQSEKYEDELMVGNVGNYKNEKHVQEKQQPPLYLAPALLPEKAHHTSSFSSCSSSHSFSFIFTPSNDLSHLPTITSEDCNKLGFLPSGLFEKLISKAISWSMITSNYVSRGNLYNCFKNSAELAFGNQRFLMIVDYYHNLITIHVLEGNNPLSIHDRLRDQIQDIISECLKSLKFLSVLKYQCQDQQHAIPDHFKNEDRNNLLFIRLNQIRCLVEEKSALSINIPGRRNLLSSTEVLRIYGPWLTDLLSLNEYDLFLSYRWGHYDSHFTKALFDRLSLHSVDQTMRTIHAFLDIKRLQVGENYQMKLVDALSKSLVIIPIVSSDALQKMLTLTSTDEDNLLIEWICGLEMIKHRQNNPGSGSRLMKFMPIFFGTRIDENNIKNFFQENMCSKLSNTRV
jgi:serine/threonine protein kinase